MQSPMFPIRRIKGRCSTCMRGNYRPLTVLSIAPPNAPENDLRYYKALCLRCARAFGEAAK